MNGWTAYISLNCPYNLFNLQVNLLNQSLTPFRAASKSPDGNTEHPPLTRTLAPQAGAPVTVFDDALKRLVADLPDMYAPALAWGDPGRRAQAGSLCRRFGAPRLAGRARQSEIVKPSASRISRKVAFPFRVSTSWWSARARQGACVRSERHCVTLEAQGLLAVCIQHELDHLEGKFL